MSGFQMVLNRPSKCPVFECFRYLNVRFSDNDCTCNYGVKTLGILIRITQFWSHISIHKNVLFTLTTMQPQLIGLSHFNKISIFWLFWTTELILRIWITHSCTLNWVQSKMDRQYFYLVNWGYNPTRTSGHFAKVLGHKFNPAVLTSR